MRSAVPAEAWKRCMYLAAGGGGGGKVVPCSDIRRLKAVHAVFVTHGIHRSTYALSRLILLSAESAAAATPGGDGDGDGGSDSRSFQFLPYTDLLFQHAEAIPNSFIYNTLIRAHARCSQPHRAHFYFRLMLHHHHHPSTSAAVVPDHHTFPFVLHACASLHSPSPGQQIHSHVFKNGLASADHFIQTALLRFYVRFMHDLISDARKLFDELPTRDPIHCDVLMNGYLRHDLAFEALLLFQDLLVSGSEPDQFTLTTALSACAHAGALKQGIWIHKYLEKKKNDSDNQSLLNDPHVSTALLSMYAKCGCIEKAVAVFNGMSQRNTFSWAAMVGGFAMHGFVREAISCLQRMQVEDGLKPDGVVILGILSACTHAGLIEEGRLLLEQMETLYGITPKHEHYSCSVDLLCRVGQLEEAVELISKMPMRPLASVWGSLLTACRTYGNDKLAELAAEELLRMEPAGGAVDADGIYIQLSNIFMNVNRHVDASRVRKLMGSKHIKKMPGCSVIEVNGVVSSFVAGDQVHPLRLSIYETLDLFTYHVTQQPIDDVILLSV